MKKLHITNGALIGLCLVVVLFAFSSVYAIHKADVAAGQVHSVLCTQKHNVEDNLKTTRKFLKEHPNGTADFSLPFLHNALQKAITAEKSYEKISCGVNTNDKSTVG